MRTWILGVTYPPSLVTRKVHSEESGQMARLICVRHLLVLSCIGSFLETVVDDIILRVCMERSNGRNSGKGIELCMKRDNGLTSVRSPVQECRSVPPGIPALIVSYFFGVMSGLPGEKLKQNMSPVKRICVFEHSVMTNFNCACPDIQRG